MNRFGLLLAVTAVTVSACGGASDRQDVNALRAERSVPAEPASPSIAEPAETRREARVERSDSERERDTGDRPSRDEPRASSKTNAAGADRPAAGTGNANEAAKEADSVPEQPTEASGNAAVSR